MALGQRQELISPLIDFVTTNLEPLQRVTFHSVMALKYASISNEHGDNAFI